LKKRSKKLLSVRLRLSPTVSAQTRKSFLVLFFKKEPLTYLRPKSMGVEAVVFSRAGDANRQAAWQ
jgi:hypothetical protein